MNNNDYKLDGLGKTKVVFFSFFVLVSLFATSKELLFDFYIKYSSATLLLLLFISFLFFMVIKKKLAQDTISLLLLIRCGLYLIPLLFTQTMEGYLGNYITVIGSFAAYIIASQFWRNSKDNYLLIINKVVIIFLSIASLQVIYMYFLLGNAYEALNINLFKYNLITPVGGSNFIACVILPLLVFVFYSNIKKRTKIISIALGLIALLIIQSKNAIFVLIIFSIYIGIRKYFQSLKGIKENKKFVIFVSLFFIVCGSFVLFYFINYLLIKWNMGLSYSGGSIYQVINALSSNRLNVYSSELLRWTEHFIIGNGLGYETGTTRSHNWIIDLLVQAGLMGFSVYLFILFIWYKKVHPYRNSNKFIKAAYYSIIVIFIQGLAEVSVFTITIDVLLWFLIGLSISEVKSIKYKKSKALEEEQKNEGLV